MEINVRKNGRECIAIENDCDKIEAFKRIVETKSFCKIDKYTVDCFSASAVVSAYDALSEASKKMIIKATIPNMITIAFNVLSK